MKGRDFSAFPKEGLHFLRSLKRNNNREWFQKHKSIYEQHVKQPMAGLIDVLAAEFQQFAPDMLASPKVSAYLCRSLAVLIVSRARIWAFVSASIGRLLLAVRR